MHQAIDDKDTIHPMWLVRKTCGRTFRVGDSGWQKLGPPQYLSTPLFQDLSRDLVVIDLRANGVRFSQCLRTPVVNVGELIGGSSATIDRNLASAVGKAAGTAMNSDYLSYLIEAATW